MDVNDGLVCFMVFNATLNNISVISWRSIFLVEETGVPGENHRPVASHWQTLSQCCIEYTSTWTGFELTASLVIGTDCTGSCKFNYHTITNLTAPGCKWRWEIIKHYTSTQIQVKEQHFYCCSTFHSHSRSSTMRITHTIKYLLNVP